MTAVYPRPEDRKLLPVEGRVGSTGSFAEDDLQLLRWCATHYVSPLSTILKRTVPPNLPKAGGKTTAAEMALGSTVSYVVDVAPHGDRVVEVLENALGAEASALVIVPSVAEAESIGAVLGLRMGDRVLTVHSEQAAAAQTRAWEAAASTPGSVLVGTREAVLWPVAALAHMVVVEESRRVMRSPSTPTLGVREIAKRRAEGAGIGVTFLGPMPSSEVLHEGATVEAPEGRWWPLVEVVDRGEEPPSGSPLLERTRASIAGVAAQGGSAFVLVPRRGDAASYRCMRCGDLRRCGSCASAADATESCRRCTAALGACAECGFKRFRPLGVGIGTVRDDLARVVGNQVGAAGEGCLITVGTERDLIGIEDLALAVAVDFDGVALAPNYLAGESALRLLVRLAGTVARGRGHRCIVQTSDPGQPVVRALRSGNATDFLSGETSLRRRAGFPPYGQLLALEIAHEDEESALDERLRVAVGAEATVLGPAPMPDRSRWLLQARDLSAAKVSLRDFVRSVRDRGGRVRVDVDPIDL